MSVSGGVVCGPPMAEVIEQLYHSEDSWAPRALMGSDSPRVGSPMGHV